MGYYTDRHLGTRPRTATEINEPVRLGILSIVRSRASDGSFGHAFPEYCPDGEGVSGTDINTMASALVAHRLYNPFERQAEQPTTFELLDLIEFSYERIAKPVQDGYHSYYRHHHLSFEEAEGKASFRAEIDFRA